ncbi:LysE family translocator [Porphyrobacter sp. AAP82]|uniref:LysE family translocator n=1 Tax=Porphyrobacter sp. AAP82 TaxID=1248917 RepID=UPI0002D7462D|nr:LysE family transporter [Porphyrobacter sp. AAP82]
MIDPAVNWGGFALAVLLVELTPGPNMAWLVTLTLSQGRRAGLGAIAGVAAGLAANAALSVLAASLILSAGAGLTQGVSLMAAPMMAWLAWEAWRDAGESATAAPPEAAAGRHAAAGFVINLLNPKSALFLITVMPQFVSGGRPGLAAGLALGAVSVAIASGVHLSLVLLAEHARAALMAEDRARAIRRGLALAMLGVGLWFLAKALA